MVCTFCREYIPVGKTVCPTCGKPIELIDKAEESAPKDTAKKSKKKDLMEGENNG